MRQIVKEQSTGVAGRGRTAAGSVVKLIRLRIWKSLQAVVRDRIVLLIALLALASTASGVEEPVGALTELHVTTGRIEMLAFGSSEWQVVKPLLSVRPGDQVRATGSARAVIVLIGRPTVVVTANNSPFVVVAAPSSTLAARAKSVLSDMTRESKTTYVRAGIMNMLPVQGYRTYQSLSVGSVRAQLAQLPIILSPRETRVLLSAIAFEWAGSDRLKYSVKLLGAQGTVVWEQADVELRSIPYPPSGPKLTAGARYTWELATREHGVQRASVRHRLSRRRHPSRRRAGRSRVDRRQRSAGHAGAHAGGAVLPGDALRRRSA
jgi:hypothetical protein